KSTCVSVRADRRSSSRPAGGSERSKRRSTSRSCCPSTSSARSRRTSMATLGRSGLASAVVLALLLVAAPGWAGQPTDQLRTEINRVLKVLDDPELKKEEIGRASCRERG